MANRFALLTNFDPIGSFEAGQAQARQVQREQFADQQLRDQVNRGNQFRQLAGQAYGAGNRADRQAAISQAAAIDPQAAMNLDTQLAGNEEAKQKRLGVWARALLNVPEGPTRQMLYQQMRPEMQQFGINAPEQYTPEVGQMAQAFVDMASGQTPSQLQYFRSMTQGLSPEDTEQARRVALGLEGRASSAGMSMQKVTGPDGREYAVVFDPRTGAPRPVSMQELFGGAPQPAAPGAPTPSPGAAPIPTGTPMAGLSPAEKAAQEAQAKANVELQMQPQIARQTAIAQEEAKREGERGKKAMNAGTVLGMLDLADPLIDAATGSLVGAGRDALAQAFGAAPEGAQAIAQLRVLQAALMTNMPRMEGPQSDRDVDLYRQAAGQIGDPAVPNQIKKAAVRTIRALQQQYANGGQPRAPAPAPSRSPAQIPPTNARGWVLMRDAQGNQAYVSPDGSQFEEVR